MAILHLYVKFLLFVEFFDVFQRKHFLFSFSHFRSLLILEIRCVIQDFELLLDMLVIAATNSTTIYRVYLLKRNTYLLKMKKYMYFQTIYP